MKKFVFVSAGLLMLAAPIGLAILLSRGSYAQAGNSVAFDVASVKQHQNYTTADFRSPVFLPGGRFTSTASMDMVIAAAWGLPYHPGGRLSGGPKWIHDRVFDIDARAEKDRIPDSVASSSRSERMRPMLQKLLIDRFHLVIHRETKVMPIYALVVAKGGPKLEKADVEEKDCPASTNINLQPGDTIVECHVIYGGRGRGLHARAADVSDLARAVEAWTDRPLIDQTGIKGLYRIATKGWLPLEAGPPSTPGAKSEDGTALVDLPTLFQMFEGLGLKMESQRGKAEIYVIDHIDSPTEN